MEKKNNKAAIREELEQIAPGLARLKKQDTQKAKDDIPPRYFRELPDDLWNRIQEEEGLRSKAPYSTVWQQALDSLSQMLRSPIAIGMATVVCLLIGLWYFNGQADENWIVAQESQQIRLESIPEEVLYDYVIENIADYNTADFADFEQALPLNELLPIRSDEQVLDQMINEYLEQSGDLDLNELL